MVTGAVALAEFAARGRQEVPGQHRAAHRPLPQGQARRLRPAAARDLAASGSARGEDAAVPVAHVGRLGRAAGREPARSPRSCSTEAAAAKIILEIEIGVVGGEEDGVADEINEKLYTTADDAHGAPSRRSASARTAATWSPLTFGNVHGVYKPGNVKLRPEILKEIQDAVGAEVRPGDASRSTSSSTAAPARCGGDREPRSTTAWSR